MENQTKLNNKDTKQTAALDTFKELYQAADLYHSHELEKMERNMRQYLGSPEIDGSSEPAATVRNITFEIVG